MSIISAGTSDANRCGTISLGRHRNSSVGGTPTIVQDGDALGAVMFSAGDGTDMRTAGAKIHAEVDGTPGSNDMPGALVFSTTPDGSSTPGSSNERLRITSTARFGFNTANPPRDYCFHSGQADTNIQITNNTTGVDDSAGALIQQDGNDLYIWNKENSFMSLGTNNAQKLQITSGGSVNIGGNYTQTTYKMQVTGTFNATGNITQNGNALATNGKAIAMAFIFG